MTDERDDPIVDSAGIAEAGEPRPAVTAISRRALLRGASAAVPTVLTLGSGSALAASSFKATGSAVEDPVGEYYVCLEGAEPGVPYYYDNGADATAISANRWFVNAAEFYSKLQQSHHVTNLQKVEQAIAQCTKYRGDQLCADGQEYIPLAPNSQTSPIVRPPNFPVLRKVSVPPGALLSTSQFNSMDASGKLTTTALNL